ncbi:MAG: hypothetical protein PF517_08980 [Salinivirgaceae bacterium]|jgi:hypothetical protein|nr:hypothetical protein [Salinivirgaceae bacterium]
MNPFTKKIAFAVINVIISIQVFAQIPVGEWRDHLPYSNVKTITLGNNRVYCATEMAMFYYDLSDGSIQKLSKINKLSDLEPGYIAFSKKTNKLIIGYTNGNIDILENDSKFNFPDIKLKNIVANKKINHILIPENFAYLSTGFGIVVFNLEKNEFADTYIIGEGSSYINVNSTIIFNNVLYALTDNGVLSGQLDDPFLSNYQNWDKVETLLNPNGSYTNSAIFNNELMLVNNLHTNDSCHLIAYSNQGWDTVFTNLKRIRSLAVNNESLIIAHKKQVEVFNSDFEITTQINFSSINHTILDNDNNIWLGHTSRGLVHYIESNYQKAIKPNGPGSKNAFKVYNNNGSILVGPGGFTPTGAGTYTKADVYNFSAESWSSLRNNIDNNNIMNSLRDVTGFASQNSSQNYMVTTYYRGIFEIVDNKIVNIYNSSNTNGILGDTIGGITYDNNGNLYIVSNFSAMPFVVKTPDNKWYHYEYDSRWKDFRINSSIKLINTNNNDKWTISSRGKGIMVFNDNATPGDRSDDIYKMFSLKDDKNTTISSQLNDIVQDIEGAIWIATSNGVAVYDYPKNALRADYEFDAHIPQIEVDGYLKGLLEGEHVTCIAVDGGNRKWLGTDGAGLFLVSANGTEQIISWNTDNSKLLSNNINSIDVNQKTGEVFIGTDKGLQSYKSTSTESKANYSDIYAFPNPVKGDYNGVITIRGLMYQTNVKITDLSGNRVFETTSNGGDAIWNGKDMTGNKVASGIYLVLCALPDGSESEATKILIVN